MTPQQAFEQAAAAEGIVGTPLYDIALKTAGFESGWDPSAVSNRGATGLMQVMPATFNEIADPGWDINDPYANARAGIRYLKQGYEASGGDPALTGAYYYGGPGGMQAAMNGEARYDPKNPDYPSTLEYGQRLANAVGQGQRPMNTNFPNALGASTFPQIMSRMEQAVPDPKISPELIEGITRKKQKSQSLLPLAIGAALSGDKKISALGASLYDKAMGARELVPVGDEGFINPTNGTFMRSPIGEERRNLALATAALEAESKQMGVLSNFALQSQIAELDAAFRKAGIDIDVSKFLATPAGQRYLASGQLTANPMPGAGAPPTANSGVMPQAGSAPGNVSMPNGGVQPGPRTNFPNAIGNGIAAAPSAQIAGSPSEVKALVDAQTGMFKIQDRDAYNAMEAQRQAAGLPRLAPNFEVFVKSQPEMMTADRKRLDAMKKQLEKDKSVLLDMNEFTKLNQGYATGGWWENLIGDKPLFYSDTGDKLISLSSKQQADAPPEGQGTITDYERNLFGNIVQSLRYDAKTNEAIRDWHALRTEFKNEELRALQQFRNTYGTLRGAENYVYDQLVEKFKNDPRYQKIKTLLPADARPGSSESGASNQERKFKVIE